jgi:hypothetical protein
MLVAIKIPGWFALAVWLPLPRVAPSAPPVPPGVEAPEPPPAVPALPTRTGIRLVHSAGRAA